MIIRKDIAELNESETRDFLESMVDHIDANGWQHLYNNIDYVKHLEEKNAELLRESVRADGLRGKIERAINEIDKITITLINETENK